MSWAPLLVLSALCACSKAQLVVTQRPSASVAPGGTATVSCSISTGTIGDGHYPRWVQHIYGNVPRGLIYNTNVRPEGTPARFSGSRSGNTMSLTITEVEPQDDASYYCVVWAGSSSHSDTVPWGRETKTLNLRRCC
ncbi:hypothetical protein NDU88_006785 [Pleurodeles waltl]|uniref:Ig-like domain-containing protein n=1 Tax=Pleurodeles waltl TaxID=8319 RepID=A0AAV7LSW8_PLEWA|nr:hypothetical protein NDU88_006785 [Pleurodeles waltl]